MLGPRLTEIGLFPDHLGELAFSFHRPVLAPINSGKHSPGQVIARVESYSNLQRIGGFLVLPQPKSRATKATQA